MTIFSQDQLDKIVSETIPQETDHNHTNAVVFGLDQTGAKVVAHFERDEASGKWALTADAVAAYDWTGNKSVGAHVGLKW